MAFTARARGGLLRTLTSLSLITHVPRVGGLPNGLRTFSSILQRTNTLPFSRPFAPAQNVYKITPFLLARTYAVASTPPTSTPEEIAASTTSALAATPTEPISASIIDPALPTVDLISNTITQSLQPGDLAALHLTGWGPTGFIRWFFEIFHFVVQLPYFYSVIGTVVLIRLIVFPAMIYGLRLSIKLQSVHPQMEELAKDFQRVKNSQNPIERQRLALKQQQLFAETGANPMKALYSPAIQLPLNVGMFFGFKGLFSGEVPGMNAFSGFELIPDLSATTPWAMPILLAGGMMILLKIQAREMNLKIKPTQGHMLNIFRTLSLVGAAIMQTFSAGLVTALMTASLITIVQSWSLQQPPVRRLFNIPPIKYEDQGPVPSFMESFEYYREWFREGIFEQMVQDRPELGRRPSPSAASVNAIKKPTIQLPKMVAPKPVTTGRKAAGGKKTRV